MGEERGLNLVLTVALLALCAWWTAQAITRRRKSDFAAVLAGASLLFAHFTRSQIAVLVVIPAILLRYYLLSRERAEPNGPAPPPG